MAAFVLKCPVCEKKFKYDVSEGWPDFCVLCGADINNRRSDDEIVMPAFLSQKTRNNDKVARDVMDGSEVRVNLAAAMSGVPASEMSGLKITDLNDRNDTQFAAKEVVNSVTQRMDQMRAAGMPTGFGAAQAQEFAANAHAPMQTPEGLRTVEPYAGLRARNRIQRALPSIGQAPLPNEITSNPNYRSPV